MMLNLANTLPARVAAMGLAQTAPAWSAANPHEPDPKWLAVGLAAQSVIALCLAIHLIASRRQRRFAIPQTLGYLGTIATLVLMDYAARHHDLVFTIGQFINVLICLRLLGWIGRRRPQARPSEPGTVAGEDSRFPVVAPHQAERRATPPQSDRE
jgi:lipid-A-disaccharide synthase-like uncharacterized protein